MSKYAVSIEIEPKGPTDEDRRKEAERVREIITQLVLSDGLAVRGGSATLHFDIQGNLMEIEIRYLRKWKRRTP